MSGLVLTGAESGIRRVLLLLWETVLPIGLHAKHHGELILCVHEMRASSRQGETSSHLLLEGQRGERIPVLRTTSVHSLLMLGYLSDRW